MSRLDRRNRKDVEFKNKGGLFDLFDNGFKETFRVNDNEYDYIIENATDEELGLLLSGDEIPFTKRKQLLIMIDKYLKQLNNE